ncbi:hypothetical protein ACFR9U_07730 [Halorientalis brevis]|uniref:Cadherin domain-containing protein n=1 Tax=Halorientalis brevis TaxID=1126241 RepID=A0ABD6CA60_9EURY|nr:hypothetical protein [Halorientalis brevis]
MDRIPTFVVLLVIVANAVGLAVTATQTNVFGGDEGHGEKHGTEHTEEHATTSVESGKPGTDGPVSTTIETGATTGTSEHAGDDRETGNGEKPTTGVGDERTPEDSQGTTTQGAPSTATADERTPGRGTDAATPSTGAPDSAQTTTATRTDDGGTTGDRGGDDGTGDAENGNGDTGDDGAADGNGTGDAAEEETADGNGDAGDDNGNGYAADDNGNGYAADDNGNGDAGDDNGNGDAGDDNGNGDAADDNGNGAAGDGREDDNGNGDAGDDGGDDNGETDEEGEEPTVVEGEPDISVFAPNRTAAPGDRRQFAVQVVNSGELDVTDANADPADEDRVRTASNVQVTLEDGGSPIEVRGGTVGLGALQSGDTAQAGFEIVVPGDADADTYDLDVEVEYEYVDESGDDAADTETETISETVELVVTEEARFEVDSVDADVQPGETDTVEVDIENVGDEDVTDAAVRFISRNRKLRVDSSNRTVRYVGDWDAGDEEEVSFQVTARNGSVPQDYAITAVVRYTDDDGNRRRSQRFAFGVTPDDEQEFELDDVEGPLSVGETGTITGELSNEGPEAATDAVLRIESPDDDVVPQRDEFVLGDLDDGDDEEFTFPVRVAENAEPGARQFEFVVQYLDENGDPRGSETLLASVDVEDEDAAFDFDDVEQTLQVGMDGTIDLTLTNELDEDLTDARVSIRSPNEDLTIGDGENASRFVGDWDDGDDETVTVPAELGADATADSYPLVATVGYTDEDGDTNRSDPIRFGVTPAQEQEFRIGNVTSTLSVSEEGVVRGRLTNVGPRNVTNGVLRLQNGSQNVDPREAEFAVDGLAAGSSTRFSFPIDVRENAEPGPRQLAFRVSYRDADDDRRQSDTIPVRVVVGPETDEFDVAPASATVRAGSTGTVTLVISNNRDYTLRNVNAKVFVTEPLSSDDDQAFVSRLGPNETVRLSFDVSASGDASPKTFPLKIDFQYEEPDGETKLSDTYQVGVNVTESDGGLLGDVLSVTAAVMGVLLPIAGGYLWHRQQ